MIAIVTALEACRDAIWRPVQTLATSNVIRIVTVNPTATPTLRESVVSLGNDGSVSDRLRMPRRSATTRAAKTTMNTAVQVHSIKDHKL